MQDAFCLRLRVDQPEEIGEAPFQAFADLQPVLVDRLEIRRRPCADLTLFERRDLRARMKEDKSKTFAPSRNKKEGVKKESFMGLLWLIVFLGIWILLQAVVLPKMGVST